MIARARIAWAGWAILLWLSGTAGAADVSAQAAMLTPDETGRLEYVPDAEDARNPFAQSLLCRDTKTGQETWRVRLPGKTTMTLRPRWIGWDFILYAGEPGVWGMLGRYDGRTGKPRWQVRLPVPAKFAGWPEDWARSFHADKTFATALDRTGAVRFYDAGTGRALRVLRPVRVHKEPPFFREGRLIVAGPRGRQELVLADWLGTGHRDLVKETLAAARAQSEAGKREEALRILDDLLETVPEEQEVWAARVKAAEADGRPPEAWGRAMLLALNGQQSDPLLAARGGPVRVYRLGAAVTQELRPAGRYVCAGTSDGGVYGIDVQTWRVVPLSVADGGISRLGWAAPLLVRSHAYGGSESLRLPQGPYALRDLEKNWIGHLTIDDGIVTYIPNEQGVLIATMTQNGGRVDTQLTSDILPHPRRNRWQILIDPRETFGYGPGGLYVLDERYNPVKWRLRLPGKGGENTPVVTHLSAAGESLGMVVYEEDALTIRVYDRASGQLRHRRPLAPLMTHPYPRDLSACGAGYLHVNGTVTWVPAAGPGEFVFGPSNEQIKAALRDNDRGLPFYLTGDGLGDPLVVDNYLFVSGKDLGCVFVFDLGAMAARAGT